MTLPPYVADDPLIIRARVFATAAHAAVGQKRKYTGEPYIVHPTNVASIVWSATVNYTLTAAAFLHDVVEDTGVTLEDIAYEFGEEVARLVEQLTDVSKTSDGNRAKRKEIDRQHLAKASPAGKTIKLADLIDNASTILRYDPDFAKVYLREKAALLEVLREGDAGLYEQASCIVQDGLSRINLA